MSHTHTCIKPGCGTIYTDTDQDAYYCHSCKKQKDAIAKSVDQKMAGRVTTEVKSDLDIYNEALKNNPISKGGVRAVNAKDMGWL